jgi:hypothetical protein
MLSKEQSIDIIIPEDRDHPLICHSNLSFPEFRKLVHVLNNPLLFLANVWDVFMRIPNRIVTKPVVTLLAFRGTLIA